MKARFECIYCGYTWVGYANTYRAPECDRCHDKQIKVREIDNTSTDCFGYKDDEKRLEKEKELEKSKLFSHNSSSHHSRYDLGSSID
jgi:hypothetical protein